MKLDDLKAMSLELPSGKSRVFMHRDVAADRGVIKQIYIQKDYSLKRLVRRDDILKQYQNIISRSKKPLILDAGANIGASAAWFQSVFPESQVLAFEPDKDNYILLERNTYGLDVDLRCAAVGSTSGRANISNPTDSPWAYRVEASDSGNIEFISLANAIAKKTQENFETLIVKIDIEGGEDNLFRDDLKWVEDVPLIIIELHDWLLPKQGTSKNFLRAVARLDRDFVHIGENIFSISNNI